MCSGVMNSGECFNLPELIDNLIAMTKNDIEIHNHNFEVRVGKIYHENVSGDSLHIQQIIINVMSNAVKYTPNGGNIIFSIEERHDKSKNIWCYEFTIEDNGIGMTKEFQKIIFESFTRADDKRTSKIQGTGLGMTIVRNIVNMMNGNIKTESEPGKGSRFTITIFLKLDEGKDVLIVGHGAMNSSIVCRIKNIGLDRFWSAGIENCKLMKLM